MFLKKIKVVYLFDASISSPDHEILCCVDQHSKTKISPIPIHFSNYIIDPNAKNGY